MTVQKQNNIYMKNKVSCWINRATTGRVSIAANVKGLSTL